MVEICLLVIWWLEYFGKKVKEFVAGMALRMLMVPCWVVVFTWGLSTIDGVLARLQLLPILEL